MNGWIKLHRNLADHWLWEDKPFSRGQAWIDLLFMVNHKENKTFIDGRLEEVKRGQTITSIRKLCDRWGWSNTKVKKFLLMLEQDEMIVVKSDSKKTVVTIVKYEVYQDSDSEKTTVKHQSNDSEASLKHTNKNEKNVKNEKKDILCKADASELFERLWKLYPLKRGKGKVSEAKKKQLLDIGYEQMEKAIDRYKADLAKDDWRKPQNGSTFFSSGYLDYLDGNYEKPKAGPSTSVKTQFHNFEEREYDFDELEKRLFEQQLGG